MYNKFVNHKVLKLLGIFRCYKYYKIHISGYDLNDNSYSYYYVKFTVKFNYYDDIIAQNIKV